MKNILLLLSLILISVPAWAEDEVPIPAKTIQKISIDTKGKMSFRMKENIMVFNEKPFLIDGIKTSVTLIDGKNKIICDTLTIHLKEGTTYGKEFDENSVEEIEIKGTVTVKNESVLIYADRGLYTLEPTPVITFIGDPASVSRDGSTIKSKRIMYYKDEDRIEIDPDGSIEIEAPEKK